MDVICSTIFLSFAIFLSFLSFKRNHFQSQYIIIYPTRKVKRQGHIKSKVFAKNTNTNQKNAPKKGNAMSEALPTVTLAGLSILNTRGDTLRAYLREGLSEGKAVTLFTPNGEMLCRAWKEPWVAALLRKADLLLPDGVALLLYAKAQGTPIAERSTGIDLGEWILALAAKEGLSVYLLGGKEGVAKEAAERLRGRLPALKVVGTHHGYVTKENTPSLLREIEETHPHILLVCMGFPRQEEWILSHRERFPSVRLFMGLGGALDVWSGRIPRAPLPFQRMGLEWLWRTLAAPSRIPRLRFLFPLCRLLLEGKRNHPRRN
jgi:N-acetylglucosaminyldiphosphoundecaprenol N-acetyl-beta-D-mannosaminyltransferase